MSDFLNKIPVSPITSFGSPSVPNNATFGTNFSILQTGGYMEVYDLSGLTYTIPPATTGIIEFSGNSVPIQLVKGSGSVFSPDVLTLNSDNISSGRRKLGMLVYVYETNKIYQFRIDNYDTLWNNATGATGPGGQTVVISDYGTTVKNNSAAGIAFISAWTSSTISGIGGYNDTNASWRVLQTGGGETFTGGTVTGATIFTGGLTANTISATTYYNLSSNFKNEIHVSQVDGNDTTGDGSLLNPVASITKALTLITGQRRTIVIHPGYYTESPSITTQYTTLTTPAILGGNTVILGTVSTSIGCTISGLKMTNLTITAPTGTGNVNILNCEITGTLTKSSTADYTLIRFCDVGTINITGSNLVAIFGGNPNFITVNNAAARVIVKTAVTVAPVLTAGSLSLVDSIVVAAVTNAFTSAAGTFTTLANSQFLISALNNVAPVVLNGFYSILNCVFDKPNSTLVALSGTGGSTNSIDYFQYINADKFITQGGTSLQYVMGDGSLSNGFTGGTVTGATNFTGGLSANTISATTYLNLPSSGGSFTGGTVSGATIFTGGLSANTISATTYQGLPITVLNSNSLISTGLSGTTGFSFTTIQNSNFFGVDSGYLATGATNSNFFGRNAGNAGSSPNGANNSNFIGNAAGQNARFSSNSNFFGQNTGGNATSANNSNFLGLRAGQFATNSANSNFLGTDAGYNATTANNSNFLGQFAGQNGTAANESNFFGSNAGDGATNASYANFIGSSAGKTSTGGQYSNFIGNSAGNGATSASQSNFFGRLTGYQAINASNSTLIGTFVGRADVLGSIGSNNIIIGTNISLPTATTNSINIGGVLFGTGTYSATTGNPSITAQTNGRIGINVLSPTEALDVLGNTRIQGRLTATTISATTYLNLPASGGSFTGGTVSGATTFTNGLTANTFSATTIVGGDIDYLLMTSFRNLYNY